MCTLGPATPRLEEAVRSPPVDPCDYDCRLCCKEFFPESRLPSGAFPAAWGNPFTVFSLPCPPLPTESWYPALPPSSEHPQNTSKEYLEIGSEQTWEVLLLRMARLIWRHSECRRVTNVGSCSSLTEFPGVWLESNDVKIRWQGAFFQHDALPSELAQHSAKWSDLCAVIIPSRASLHFIKCFIFLHSAEDKRMLKSCWRYLEKGWGILPF